MPEDLPVTKCINVMVGIRRSKVIYFFKTEKVLESNHNPSDLGLGAHKSPGKNTSDLGLVALTPMSPVWLKS